MRGLTLKQFAARAFYDALEEYREALKSKDSERIVKASLKAYVLRRNKADSRALNRVYREVNVG